MLHLLKLRACSVMHREFSWLLLLGAALIFAPFVACLKDAPVVAFLAPGSDNPMLNAAAVDELQARGPYMTSEHAVERLMHHRSANGKPSMCDLDKVVNVQVDTLNHDSFAPLHSRSSLKKRVMIAPSQLVLPSVDQSESSFTRELMSAFEKLCDDNSDKDRVIKIRIPSIDTHGTLTKPKFLVSTNDLESEIASKLEHIDAKYPNYVVVVSRTPSYADNIHKRALPVKAKADAPLPTKFLERNQVCAVNYTYLSSFFLPLQFLAWASWRSSYSARLLLCI